MPLLELFLPTSAKSILIVSLACTLVAFVYNYLRNKFSYWSRRGMPSVHPAKSILYTLQFLFGRKQMLDPFHKQYQDLNGLKYGGSYQLMEPSIILRDPETIKTWLVKGFQSFHDRGIEIDETHDELSGNLIQLTGKRWREVRHKLAPAFSTAKLKIMYQTLQGCARELDAYLQRLCSETGDAEVEIKGLMSNYTMEVIGACAMGIRCNAIQDPDCEFKKIANSMFQFGLRRAVHSLLELIHPKLPKILGLKPIKRNIEEVLQKIVKEAIEMKKRDAEGAAQRKDFLQILMNIRQSELSASDDSEDDRNDSNHEAGSNEDQEGPIFTEKVMVGVISSFLSAGFDTVACVLTLCIYELALHPEIQEEIFEEIKKVKGDADDISYEDLKKFQYTDQVINETLRKYPVAVLLGRNCTEPFAIPDTSLVVEKDTRIFIPVYSIHHDPEYFPEPEKFDPNRFSEENAHNMDAYMPFGVGPRFCIGQRLGLLEVKVMVLQMVANFTLHTCANTQTHLEFDKSSMLLSPKGGLRLRIQKRPSTIRH